IAEADLVALRDYFTKIEDLDLLREVEEKLFDKGTSLDLENVPSLQNEIATLQEKPSASKYFEFKDEDENEATGTPLEALVSKPVTTSFNASNQRKRTKPPEGSKESKSKKPKT